jgi:transketolase
LRITFIDTLTALAAHDDRIVLLTGDLGYLVVERFAERHPNRFFNVGVAEQNMIGLATGLAESGFVPFAYSIAPFALLRPFEFIRNGPVLHQFPVRIVGVGGGVEYGPNGVTHYALEDLAIARSLPDLRVIAPADAAQGARALRASWSAGGPTYYRLGKDERRLVPGLDGRLGEEGGDLLRSGRDVLVLAIGSIASEAAAAVEALCADGVDAGFGVVWQLNPAPVQFLRRVLHEVRAVVTVEAHYVTGGLGTVVSELVAMDGLAVRVTPAGFTRMPRGVSGPEAQLLAAAGLDRVSLERRVRGVLEPAV